MVGLDAVVSVDSVGVNAVVGVEAAVGEWTLRYPKLLLLWCVVAIDARGPVGHATVSGVTSN